MAIFSWFQCVSSLRVFVFFMVVPSIISLCCRCSSRRRCGGWINLKAHSFIAQSGCWWKTKRWQQTKLNTFIFIIPLFTTFSFRSQTDFFPRLSSFHKRRARCSWLISLFAAACGKILLVSIANELKRMIHNRNYETKSNKKERQFSFFEAITNHFLTTFVVLFKILQYISEMFPCAKRAIQHSYIVY